MAAQHAFVAPALARALVGSREERPQEDDAMRRGGATRIFLAEHYSPGLDAGRVQALARRLRAAHVRGGAARFLAAAALPEDDSLLSFFAASSPEAVARLVERADVAADRIVPALWHACDR